MKLFESFNEHGIPVAHYLCNCCNTCYAVTPAPDKDDDWQACLAPDCESYDPSRDMDDLFDD